MARLIDADELMKSIEDNSYPVSQKNNSIEKGMVLTGIKRCIEEQPTVDAAPVRRGKWVEDSTYENIYECSECAEKFILIDGTPEQNSYNFCPNCGAKMQEESENG